MVIMFLTILAVGFIVLKQMKKKNPENNITFDRYFNASYPNRGLHVPGSPEPLMTGIVDGTDSDDIEFQMKSMGFRQKDIDDFYSYADGAERTPTEIFNWLYKRAAKLNNV